MPKRKIFLNSCCISISIFICSFLFLTPYFLQKKIYVFLNIEQLFFLFNIVEPPPISFYFCTIFTYYFVSQIDCPSKKKKKKCMTHSSTYFSKELLEFILYHVLLAFPQVLFDFSLVSFFRFYIG